ncbi:unnamed protein product [Rhizophagus irregularis]|nr:unnamed protein product [Rhizophagus irregularis]
MLDIFYKKMFIMDIINLLIYWKGYVDISQFYVLRKFNNIKVGDDETVTLTKFLENVDGGIMTSNTKI